MDEQGGDAACWAAQFDDPLATRVMVRKIDAASDADGRRVLVDAAAPADWDGYDLWLPEIAPESALLAWYDDRLEHWEAFRADYARQLTEFERGSALATLERLARHAPVTLLTAAPDPSRSAAEVVRSVVTERLGDPTMGGRIAPRS